MSDKKEDSAASHPPDDGETRPLPEGWIKQFDSKSNAWFYVDTQASPPRSIWVHPYDDQQYLNKHPEAKHLSESPEYQPPPSPPVVPTASRPNMNEKGKGPEKRGFLGKLKDKAIGTKEERMAAKRLREEERLARLARQREHAAQYGAPPQMYPGQYQEYSQYQQYPHYRQYPGGGFYGPGYGQSSRRGGLGGGMALPLLGGLAGGFLLGEALSGDGFGGGFGGDFGGGFGGDFGGGGF